MKQAAKKANTKDIAHEILAARNQANNTIAFPQRSTEHTTPELKAAATAATAASGQVVTATETEQQEHQAFVKSFGGNVEVIEETSRHRYRRWVNIDRRIVADEISPITTEEHQFFKSYQQTPEFRAEQQIHEDFGLLVEGHPVRQMAADW